MYCFLMNCNTKIFQHFFRKFMYCFIHFYCVITCTMHTHAIVLLRKVTGSFSLRIFAWWAPLGAGEKLPSIKPKHKTRQNSLECKVEPCRLVIWVAVGEVVVLHRAIPFRWPTLKIVFWIFYLNHCNLKFIVEIYIFFFW